MRGRSRNKGPNPLTRAYESNGPDVKIRGTAQHIADKYAQLARDAQASGDPVAAENYLQHGEHYFRMIAAAQEQYRLQYGVTQRPFDEDGDEGDEEVGGYAAGGGDRAGGDEFGEAPGYGPPPSDMRPYEPRGGGDRPQQPRFENRGGGDRPNRGQGRFDRPNGGFDRQNGERFNGGGDRYERQNGPDRFGGERPPQGGNERFDRPRPDRPDTRERFGREGGQRDFAGPREPRPDREPRHDRETRGDREPRPEMRGGEREPRPERAPPPLRAEPRGPDREQDAPAGDLPAFLTNPIRPILPVAEASEEPAVAPFETSGASAAELNGARPARRRRARKADIVEEGGDGIEPVDAAE